MAGAVKNGQNNVTQSGQCYTTRTANAATIRRAVAAAQVEQVQPAASAGHPAALDIGAVLVDMEGVQEVGLATLE